jgi:hypothetical protein
LLIGNLLMTKTVKAAIIVIGSTGILIAFSALRVDSVLARLGGCDRSEREPRQSLLPVALQFDHTGWDCDSWARSSRVL